MPEAGARSHGHVPSTRDAQGSPQGSPRSVLSHSPILRKEGAALGSEPDGCETRAVTGRCPGGPGLLGTVELRVGSPVCAPRAAGVRLCPAQPLRPRRFSLWAPGGQGGSVSPHIRAAGLCDEAPWWSLSISGRSARCRECPCLPHGLPELLETDSEPPSHPADAFFFFFK